MSDIHYTDLLWDFVPGADGDRSFLLRVLDSGGDVIADSRRGPPGPKGRPFIPPATSLRPSGARRGDAEIRAMGRDLRAALGDAPMPRAGAESVVRLEVSSPSQCITDLPWECLVGGDGAPLALRDDTRLTRLVRVPFPLPALTVTPPLRVLLVLTNPKDESIIDVHRERAAVIDQLPPEYEPHTLMSASMDSLREKLARLEPQIVHFVGHAGMSDGEGHIVLHDDRALTCWLSAAELAEMLPQSVRLVCLSTCFTAKNYDIRGLSRFAHAPPDVVLPCTVFNQLPLHGDDEKSVRTFWQAFYRALFDNNGQVTEALHVARCSIASSPAWASFAMVIRNATGRGFSIAPSATPERRAIELEAYFTARLANALAFRSVEAVGGAVEMLEKASRIEARRAEALMATLTGPTTVARGSGGPGDV